MFLNIIMIMHHILIYWNMLDKTYLILYISQPSSWMSHMYNLLHLEYSTYIMADTLDHLFCDVIILNVLIMSERDCRMCIILLPGQDAWKISFLKPCCSLEVGVGSCTHQPTHPSHPFVSENEQLTEFIPIPWATPLKPSNVAMVLKFFLYITAVMYMLSISKFSLCSWDSISYLLIIYRYIMCIGTWEKTEAIWE